ncbi:nitrous oxide reductase accessory protein NosL [Oryzibacter oryziterrae]|uniref:nitrous oxide reductase accessory protein NosL n=1 Tax=Oryzibacter oryziterrae TaxID=2766474 RepID=UPI001F201D20|nr:nitrous oxide reductase accessory protein NosL [Oryzibacter oryziterrae]
MKSATFALLAVLLLAAPLAACNDQSAAVKPAAIEMTDNALGYYCQMYLADHGGPKAQIHEKGTEQPLWFSQVSDAVTYLHGSERRGEVLAVYVSDMSRARSWDEPGRDNWIDADSAWFVIGSRQSGGMGTPEAIPFASKEAAAAFVADKGGNIVRLADIPDSYLHPENAPMASGHSDMSM